MLFSSQQFSAVIGICAAVLMLLAVGCYENRYARLDPLENQPGGDTTVEDLTGNSFGHAAPNMSRERRSRFFVGDSFFKQNWVMAPASTAARDGLGPQFNARSCSACHFKDGRGEPPLVGEPMVSMLLRVSVLDETGNNVPHPIYGDQLQNVAIPGVKPEAYVTLAYTQVLGEYPDGTGYSLRQPEYVIRNEGYGQLSPNLMVSPRVAPQIVGMGLLEAIRHVDILKLADEFDKNQDGISGRANFVMDVEAAEMRLGRFGWKSNQPTTRQQVAAAFAGDIGITSSLFPDENHSVAQALDHLPHGGQPEINEKILDAVTFYSMTLAVPARRDYDTPAILRGKKLFNDLNCVACHTPKFQTGDLAGFPELSNQTIFPYTDLLLHDMGPALADHRPDGKANGSEWRTPPLWGLGMVATVNKHTTLLHDGRARNVEEAILWHGGESAASRDAFKKLNQNDRTAVIRFVKSL